MANITVTLYWDMDLRKWTTTLGGTTETDPIQGLVQGDIVKFAVRFVQTGVAVVLAAPVFTASGIKADNDFTGSYLIQLSAPVLSDTTLYTFTVNPLNSANLNTFLQTYRNTWCALEIYDSVNGILTTPLELQITPGYSLSGTPTDNVAGVIVVAAGKTVTFPQSLTFPSALGTNGFQLSTDGAGTLTWAASGALTDGDKGDITVSNSGATFTIDNDVITLAKLAHMATARVVGRTTAGNGSPELLTISGTGSVAMTNTPTLVTPVLGAATATSINGITITAGGSGTLTMAGDIDTGNGGGSINTSNGGGAINTYGLGGASGGAINTYAGSGIGNGGNINTYGVGDVSGGIINTSNGGGAINTRGTGSIGLGSSLANTMTTFTGAASGTNKSIALPNLTGTVVVTASVGVTATHALFANTTGFPAYRAIATADIATALTTPGAIGGTTASTGAFTTLTSSNTTDSTTTATGAIQTLGGLGVAKSIFAGGNVNIPTTTSTVGQIKQNGTRLLHSYGTQNLFLGDGAGNFTLTGSANVGIGRATFGALTNGARNMAFGDGTMYQITSGADNCAIGSAALNAMISGSSNVGLGSSALLSTTAGGNTGIGYLAGQYNTTGVNNVFIGYNSGGASGSVDLTRCITLGTTAAITANSLSYCTVIGSDATSSTSNSVTLGRAADTVILPGGLVTVPEALAPTLNAGITVSVAVTATGFALNGTNAATLANGTNGQIKVISCTAVTAAGTATLTPTTSAADYNTIAFTAAGQTATLQYFTTGGWYILSLRGAVAA